MPTINDYTQFVFLCKNNRNNKSGTKLVLKTLIPQSDDELTLNNYDHDLRNKIILSGIIKDGNESNGVLLLTKHNITNNINFCYKNNDFNQPRLLFLKYNSDSDICNNFFFNKNDNATIVINNDEFNRNITTDQTFGSNNAILKNIKNDRLTYINYYMNIYKNYKQSDYYNIKLLDFIDLTSMADNSKNNLPSISDICNNDLKFILNDVSINNNFANNNLINYDPTYFNNILYSPDKNNNNFLNVNSTLNNFIDFTNDNLFMYNKLNNKTTLNVTYKYNNEIITLSGDDADEPIYEDISINFIVLKNKDTTNNYGKIYLHKDFNYFNCFVSNSTSNLYDSSNNPGLYNLHDNSGIIFLSLGNGITGLTQNDLQYIKFDINSSSTQGFLGFTNSRNYNSINKISFYSSLSGTTELLTDNFFADDNYNYDYTNITYTYIKEKEVKLFDVDINELLYLFDNNTDFSNNLYYSKYRNYEIYNNYPDIITNYNNNNDKYEISNKNYDTTNYKFTITTINELSNTYNGDLSMENIPRLDYRYNYNKQFDNSFILTLFYDDGTSEIMNFFDFIVNNYVETTNASDFTNVDCVFIYHDPEKTTDPAFLYPNNNIEIFRDSQIDTFEKAIVNLPSLRTSTTNYTFIPAKNGSNLSRKQIQGLIGMNNVGKLLSIVPYDDNFIIGRGFLNQYQINDTCLSEEDKVKNKINIFKNKEKTSNNNYIKTRRFANIVRSRAQNKVSKNKDLTDLSCNNIIEYPSSQNYYTPFKLFKTGRGHYLGPK